VIPNNKQTVFVFGSNEAGMHGAGAAKTAREKYGAKMGISYGHVGRSFAIPTKDEYLRVLDPYIIKHYVHGFLAYAYGKHRLKFYITAVGTGLSGIPHETMARMFEGASENCFFDEVWKPYLGNTYNYWGTYAQAQE